MAFRAESPDASDAHRNWRRARLVLGAVIAAYVLVWLAAATLGGAPTHPSRDAGRSEAPQDGIALSIRSNGRLEVSGRL